jgi:hypothetical protein
MAQFFASRKHRKVCEQVWTFNVWYMSGWILEYFHVLSEFFSAGSVRFSRKGERTFQARLHLTANK